MKKKIFTLSFLTLLVLLLIPCNALAANSFSGGTLSIDTAWSGSLQEEVARLGATPTGITTLNITGGTITDVDVYVDVKKFIGVGNIKYIRVSFVY